MYEIFEKLCEAKGLTPYKVSKATGIPTATHSNWKAGRYTPKQDKLQKIADFFERILRISHDRRRTGLNLKSKSRVFTRFSAITRRFAILECANIYILLQIL